MDGTCKVTICGWVLSIIVVHHNRHDVTQYKHVRTPLQGLNLLNFTESHHSCVYFLNVFKELGMTLFRMNFHMKVNNFCQDAVENMWIAVKEVFPDSHSHPCSAHIHRKFDDVSAGKKIHNREKFEPIRKQVDSMTQWKTMWLKITWAKSCPSIGF